MCNFRRALAIVPIAMLFCLGCYSHTTPSTPEQLHALQSDAQAALASMKAHDPGLDKFLEHACAYVIFPSVGKGGLIVGGAHGRGIVYQQGAIIGYCELTQGTVGVQLGGQTFSELICFQYKEALDRFKVSNMEFSANASAVAIQSGASASARYESGVVVFTMPRGGLMFEATLGGQKFTFEPVPPPPAPPPPAPGKI